MANITKTWSFASTAESFSFTAPGGKATGAFTSSYGNPVGCLKVTVRKNRYASDTGYFLLSGITWEDLGVPSGKTVTDVQLTGFNNRCYSYSAGNVNQLKVGPVTVRNSSGVDQVTLFSGRSMTAVDGSWTDASGTSQSVPSGIQASNSSIQVYLGGTQNVGNTTDEIGYLIDNIDLYITYSAAPTQLNSQESSSSSSTDNGTLSMSVSVSGQESASASSTDNGTIVGADSSYSTDFSEYAHQTGVPSGWTARWNTASITYNLTTSATFNNEDVLILNSTGDQRHLISKDGQDCADGEALILFTQENFTGWSNPLGPQVTSIVFRGSGAAAAETGYALGPRENGTGLILVKYTSGTYAQITGTTGLSLSASLRYWLRVRWQGTSIKGKIWQEGTEEPATWDIDITDSSFSASGWVGLRTYEASADCYVYSLGMVTGDATATAPYAGATTLSGDESTSSSATDNGTISISVSVSGQESTSSGVADVGVLSWGFTGFRAVSQTTHDVAVVGVNVIIHGAGALSSTSADNATAAKLPTGIINVSFVTRVPNISVEAGGPTVMVTANRVSCECEANST